MSAHSCCVLVIDWVQGTFPWPAWLLLPLQIDLQEPIDTACMELSADQRCIVHCTWKLACMDTCTLLR